MITKVFKSGNSLAVRLPRGFELPCGEVLRNKPSVVERMRQRSPGECHVSVITEFELFQGAARAPEERREIERA